jgi:hypothetical protein
MLFFRLLPLMIASLQLLGLAYDGETHRPMIASLQLLGLAYDGHFHRPEIVGSDGMIEILFRFKILCKSYN